jgi:hypothetical protein
MREPPAAFVARLKALCGSDWEVRYNMEVNRWEFLSTSAGGMRVSQFWGWFKNPLTGEKIEPDPVTGLVPFRELDIAAQEEVLKNLETSYLGNRHDGARNWEEWSGARIKYNKALDVNRRRQKAEDYAYALTQVDLRRPWLSDTYFQKRGKPKPKTIIIP